MSNGPGLDFEIEIAELESRIQELERQTERTNEVEAEIRELRLNLVEHLRETYGSLNPWQTVQVARHKNRPYTKDYLNLAFDEFVELHGDKHFGDDRAMLSGFAKIDRFKVMVLGHQKGRTYKERAACHFGCAHPEGYRKAMSKMHLAEKYKLPLICFIDTPGAYPGVGAEERGQVHRSHARRPAMQSSGRRGHMGHSSVLSQCSFLEATNRCAAPTLLRAVLSMLC